MSARFAGATRRPGSAPAAHRQHRLAGLY